MSKKRVHCDGRYKYNGNVLADAFADIFPFQGTYEQFKLDTKTPDWKTSCFVEGAGYYDDIPKIEVLNSRDFFDYAVDIIKKEFNNEIYMKRISEFSDMPWDAKKRIKEAKYSDCVFFSFRQNNRLNPPRERTRVMFKIEGEKDYM